MAMKPLSGIRVLDHGHVWAGPLLAGSLADMGAEVVKVQAPGRTSGVSMAGASPLAPERPPTDDEPMAYHGYDRGKRSITLNLGEDEGKDLYKRLIAISDVVVENFSAGVMSRLGLGYEVLREANEGIIVASLSATGGTEGPWRDLVTYGPSLAALYGQKGVLGYPDDPHPREDTADLDPTAAGHAFFAICAALEYRERTGRGQYIDMAQGEAAMQRIAEPIMDYVFNGRVAGPHGSRMAGFAPHGYYRAAGDDRWLSIAVRDDQEWAALVGCAGEEAPALADGRFATLAGREAALEELDQAIEAWTEQHDPMVLTQRLQAVRVAAYPVMGPAELLADENYSALLQSQLLAEPAVKVPLEMIYQSIPWKLSETPGSIQGPVPTQGTGNDYVFGELLGIDDGERSALSERGVI